MADKLKAVIVDDEARIRRGLGRLVEAADADWEVAGSFGSGKECLEAIRTDGLLFDLLITDVKMPGMDGLTLLKEVKKVMSCHAMVISGFDDFQFLQTAIREGASDYMIKPVDRDEFKARLSSIRKTIELHKKETEHLEEIERQAAELPYLKQIQKLSQITRQQDIDLSLLEWTRDFPAGIYRLLFISIEGFTGKDKSLEAADWKKGAAAINKTIEERIQLLKQKASVQVWKWEEEKLASWILINGQAGRLDREIQEFAGELRDAVDSFTPFTCSVAWSENIEDLALLPAAKEKLLTYMKFRLLYGNSQLFSKDIIDSWRKKHVTESKHMENHVHQIIYSLDSGNMDKARKETAAFLKGLRELESPEEIERAVHFLAIRITSYMMEHDQGKEENSLVQPILTITRKTANLAELSKGVLEWMNEVLHTYERKKETEDTDPVEAAKKWIDQNLDQNVTIQKIADHIFMNPTYFCQMFKSRTGETVLDYVTRSRMERARDLLLTMDAKVYDVAEKVGYMDVKYFSKLFKNYYGESPSRYKEKARI